MTVADFSAVRRPLALASRAPGALYAGVLPARRRASLHARLALSVGRIEELARPGDYLTMRVVGEPVVIARTARGELAAFSNMCVHRGVDVAQGCGNTRAFKYHVGVLHAKTSGAKFAWTDDNVHLKPGGGLSIFIPFWLPGGGENHPDALVTQQSLRIDGARIVADGVIVDPPPLAALAARLVPTVARPGASPSNV